MLIKDAHIIASIVPGLELRCTFLDPLPMLVGNLL